MNLSDINLSEINCSIVRDGKFNNCGFLHQRKSDMISFIMSKKFLSYLNNKYITAVICTPDILDEVLKFRSDIGIAICDNPRRAIFKISSKIQAKQFTSIIHSSSEVAESASVSKHNVIIGKNCVIEANVIIRENVIISDNVTIGCGSVLGNKGLMVYKDGTDNIIADHNGFLYISEGVTIMPFCVLERGIFKGDITKIGKNSILDATTGISHGCRIGKNVTIAASSRICGYTDIGDETYVGPGVIVSNNLTIGRGCNLRIGSTVIENLKDNEDVSSSFAYNHNINMINRFRTIRKYKNMENRWVKTE